MYTYIYTWALDSTLAYLCVRWIGIWMNALRSLVKRDWLIYDASFQREIFDEVWSFVKNKGTSIVLTSEFIARLPSIPSKRYLRALHRAIIFALYVALSSLPILLKSGFLCRLFSSHFNRVCSGELAHVFESIDHSGNAYTMQKSGFVRQVDKSD